MSDARDYDRVIRPIEDRMIQTVWRILRDADDADDAMQNALTQLWKKRRVVFAHPNPQALVLRLCANAAYDVLRRRVRLKQRTVAMEPAHEPVHTKPDPLNQLIQRERHEQVMHWISQLSCNQATAVLMRLVQQVSYEDIAEALGCTEATARVHVTRGRSRLAERLRKLEVTVTKEPTDEQE